jgi:hypothetical protein
MLHLGGKRRADAAAVGRVRLWAEASLPADDAAIVLVTELACHEPGCPPVETVIAVLGGTSPRTWKIPLAAADLTAADVAAALAREPDRAGHGHAPQAGCCQAALFRYPGPAFEQSLQRGFLGEPGQVRRYVRHERPTFLRLARAFFQRDASGTAPCKRHPHGLLSGRTQR